MRSARLLVAALLAPAMLGGAGSVLALATTVLGPAARADATTKPCVAVIVDGRLAGGTVQTGCATGDPRSGLEALTDAGISYAFVPRVPGQICQLDGLPACSRNSADTYWSYWWRAKGSSRWVYATSGAGSHDPEPGDTEGWVWQEGGRREPPDIAFRTVCPQATSPGTPTSSPPTTRASASAGAARTASATSRARKHPEPATDSAAPATSATPSRLSDPERRRNHYRGSTLHRRNDHQRGHLAGQHPGHRCTGSRAGQQRRRPAVGRPRGRRAAGGAARWRGARSRAS